MKRRLPSFEPLPESPKIAPDFVGVSIVLPKAIDLAKEAALSVFGVFQLPAQTVKDLSGQDPYRAVVMLLIDTSGYIPFSFNPAGKSILLEPSANSPPGMFRGYFTIDAFQMARIRPRPGRFFASAYLGGHRSPSLAVEVTGKLVSRDHDH